MQSRRVTLFRLLRFQLRLISEKCFLSDWSKNKSSSSNDDEDGGNGDLKFELLQQLGLLRVSLISKNVTARILRFQIDFNGHRWSQSGKLSGAETVKHDKRKKGHWMIVLRLWLFDFISNNYSLSAIYHIYDWPRCQFFKQKARPLQ